MKIQTITVQENDFDLKKEMKKFGYTFRSLGKKIGYDPTYLSRIARGYPTSQDIYLRIRNGMIEPKI